MTAEYQNLKNTVLSSIGKTTSKKIDNKTYYAYGEYYSFSLANKMVKHIREDGFAARATKGSFIGSYTVWVAKRKQS